MKAIRIHAHGGPEAMRWEEVELPPPGAGEARIRHTAIRGELLGHRPAPRLIP